MSRSLAAVQMLTATPSPFRGVRPYLVEVGRGSFVIQDHAGSSGVVRDDPPRP